ncbi:MAG: hypothetical protein IJS69_00615, partial [Selenomonadaceae bacterium]|nr:hypothetical protein [Selenomonadaceae bacterium]
KDFMTAWLDNVVSVNVKANTMQTYQSIFVNHISPKLGEIKVQEFSPHARNTADRKRRVGKRCCYKKKLPLFSLKICRQNSLCKQQADNHHKLIGNIKVA